MIAKAAVSFTACGTGRATLELRFFSSFALNRNKNLSSKMVKSFVFFFCFVMFFEFI